MTTRIEMQNSKIIATGLLALCAVAIGSALSAVSSLWLYPYPRALLLNVIYFSVLLLLSATVLLMATIGFGSPGRGRLIRTTIIFFWGSALVASFTLAGAAISMKQFMACNVVKGKNDICSISLEKASQCQLDAISQAAHHFRSFYLSKVSTPFASCKNE